MGGGVGGAGRAGKGESEKGGGGERETGRQTHTCCRRCKTFFFFVAEAVAKKARVFVHDDAFGLA
jgi:hypothetical protein